MSDTKTNQPLFENAIQDYLESCTSARLSQNIKLGIPEFEIRFGKKRTISKIDYDQVVKELYMHKWKTDKIDGTQYLRIIPEDSNIRLEIEGSDMIELYCKTNSFESLKNTNASHKKLKFLQKRPPPRPIGPNGMNNIDYNDFDFRISSQYEISYPITSENETVRKIVNQWNPSKKYFRCMNRVRFTHPDSLVVVDLSIVKSNKNYATNKYNREKRGILTQTIQESGVFHNVESYEIELELDNEKITKMMDQPNRSPSNILMAKVMNEIRQCIRVVLSGLQGTPYPISYSEQEQILHEYMRRIHGEDWELGQMDLQSGGDGAAPKLFPKPYFVGPSSVTLQLMHIVPNQNPSVPNISLDYTVTEKADGERALLYVSTTGKIYLIQTNLRVVFTGAITENKECFNSLLDGEYISYGKPIGEERPFLHLFAAFDIYYIGSRKNGSVRELAFCPPNTVEYGADAAMIDETQYRLNLLEIFVQKLRVQSVVKNTDKCVFHIRCKNFYKGFSRQNKVEVEEQTIFQAAQLIWNRKDLFEYVIDGLIFTPMNTGVGSHEIGKANVLGKKFTWDRCFKWKPPQYNTIDFLVQVRKDQYGKEKIYNQIKMNDESEISTVIQYKQLVLHCGFDEKRHKYVNAFSDMLFNRIPKNNMRDGGIQDAQDDDENTLGATGFVVGKGYQPVPFQPTSPYDKDACFCNVILEKDPLNSEQLYMRTAEHDTFQNNMIVEFSYNKDNTDKETAWKWVPLRVRYDKTSELRANKNNFGNDFPVANNVWHSIHFPITENMITGIEIPTEMDLDDSVYYNRVDKDFSETRNLRNFHNIYVKKYLIEKVCNYLKEKAHIDNILLLDYAVGKAGDLPKWIQSKIGFVFGVDISKDNILNAKDGACVRYLNKRREDSSIHLRAVFLHGDSGQNILSTQKAFYTEQEKEVAKAIFGQGGVQASKQLYKEYVGIGRDGFHISSCQFAMHYFFESAQKLHNFLRNLSECTRVGGYYLGTCYDGQKVFQLLRKFLKGQGVLLEKNGKKIFEITRQYSNSLEKFPENENSIGLPIHVYQESIDKVFMEYLVNFQYLDRLMEDYGFVPLTKAEIASMGIMDMNGSFENLYRQLEKEQSQQRIGSYAKIEMSKEEKTISYLNRYFIYKKVRHVSAERLDKMYKKYVGKEEVPDISFVEELKTEDSEDKSTNDNVSRSFVRKIPDKKITLNLQNYSPILEEDKNPEETENPEEDKNPEEKENPKEQQNTKTDVDFGEYQSIYKTINKDIQTKILTYPKEKQIEVLKRLQNVQQQKKKIVTAKK